MAHATLTGFALESPALAPGSPIPVRHFTGTDTATLPAGRREMALIMDDPDAPTAEPWVHWVIYGISGDARGLPESVPTDERPQNLPGSCQGRNTWGTIGYRGPSPPKRHGTHRYHFSRFALARPLNLPPGQDKNQLRNPMEGNTLARAELIGTCQR